MAWQVVEDTSFDDNQARQDSKYLDMMKALESGATISVEKGEFRDVDALRATLHSAAKRSGFEIETTANLKRTAVLVRRKPAQDGPE